MATELEKKLATILLKERLERLTGKKVLFKEHKPFRRIGPKVIKGTFKTLLTRNSEDHEVTVSYEISGSFHPQTLEDPAEYPELELTSVIGSEDGLEVETTPQETEQLEKEAQADANKNAPEPDFGDDEFDPAGGRGLRSHE
jgi:hypothetical protein